MTTLVGYGAHGKDIEQIWQAHVRHLQRWTNLRLCDDRSRFVPPPTIPDEYYLGPYSPHVRADMWKRLLPLGWRAAPPLVHPSVDPGYAVELEAGVVVARNAVLDHSIRLGTHTHVNYTAAMTRCEIGDFCTISPGVMICGDVYIGDRVFIGAGAVITNLLTIGDDAVIGAGVVLRRNVGPGEKVTK